MKNQQLFLHRFLSRDVGGEVQIAYYRGSIKDRSYKERIKLFSPESVDLSLPVPKVTMQVNL